MKEKSSKSIGESFLKASRFNFLIGCHFKSICCDPKDGDLYLSRIKSEEILMEVREQY